MSTAGGNGGGSSMRSRRSQLSSRNSATPRMWSSRRLGREQARATTASSSGSSSRLVAGAPPALLEREQRRHFVTHLDARGQSGLHGKCSEDALREGVKRADRGVVERLECARRTACAPSGSIVGRSRLRLQLAAHTVAELGGGLLGERDRGDAAHGNRELRPVGGDELDDPVDEHRRLARARPRFDEQRLVESRPHRIAAPRGRRSGATSAIAWPISSRYSPSSGAVRLRSHAVRVGRAHIVGIAVLALREELEPGLGRSGREEAGVDAAHHHPQRVVERCLDLEVDRVAARLLRLTQHEPVRRADRLVAGSGHEVRRRVRVDRQLQQCAAREQRILVRQLRVAQCCEPLL